MGVKIKRNFLNSIQFKLVSSVLIFLIPFLLLTVYNNFYAIHVFHNQVAASNKTVVSLYLEQIDNFLASVATNLVDLSTSEINYFGGPEGNDKDKHTISMIRLNNEITKAINILKSIDAIFVYSVKYNEFLCSTNGLVVYNEKKAMKEYLFQLQKDIINKKETFPEVWYVKKINDEFYLLRIIQSSNSLIGAWVKAERLLIPLKESTFGSNSISLFSTNAGEPMNNSAFVFENNIKLDGNSSNYFLSGTNKRFLVVKENSSVGNFSMVAITPDNKILSGFPYIQQVVVFIAAATIILLPIYLLILRKTVMIPVNSLFSAMKNIKKGNLDVHIKPFKTSDEFEMLNETFNNMVDQIKTLKIDNYEKKLYSQKVEYEHLQLQLKPHFFLNSLSIMYTLARSRNFDLLQEMSLCLIQYFRYMFRSSTSFVFLNEEIEHIRNYIRIQELRFPENLSSDIDIAEELLEAPIPPLVIHTFVENTVKHSITLDEKVHLEIRAYYAEKNLEPMLKIIIKDSGKGFTKDMLSKLESDGPVIDEHGEHTGIRNVQRRLELIYNGSAHLACRNGEKGGAVVEILLPLKDNHHE